MTWLRPLLRYKIEALFRDFRATFSKSLIEHLRQNHHAANLDVIGIGKKENELEKRGRQSERSERDRDRIVVAPN